MSKTKEPQTVITGITVGLDGRVFVREVVIGRGRAGAKTRIINIGDDISDAEKIIKAIISGKLHNAARKKFAEGT